MPKVISITPARGGSKGLPRKNVRLLLGKPLIAYPIEAAIASGVVDAVLVSTDDEEIAEAARKAGAEVPFLRPEELADDFATTEATLQHALLTYELTTGRTFDICVFLTATDIFRKPEWIAQAVHILRERPEIESAFSAHATSKNYWQRKPDGAYERLLPWMRTYSSRQVRQVVYREDTGLACASRARLWREGRRIGDVVEIIPNTDSAAGIDIHTEFDLFLAEQALRYIQEHGRNG
ncbi:MAG: cytidylyltransferase domain-containing protein [Candidatus Binatia bacterium]